MIRLRSFAAFLYDFVVGDDPALFVVAWAGLGATAAMAAATSAWWVLPVGVLTALAISVLRAR